MGYALAGRLAGAFMLHIYNVGDYILSILYCANLYLVEDNV